LKLLAESGIAFGRRFGGGLTRYELADGEAHHDHQIRTPDSTPDTPPANFAHKSALR
jgi:hypothetical protein